MKQIHITSAKEGMILGRTIYDENNKCLLKNGTILTDSLISKLQNKGCNILCISDGKDYEINIEECLDYDARRNIITKLKNLDLSKYPELSIKDITDSATEIVENVSQNKSIAFDLLDIRKDANYDYSHALAVAELSIAIAKHYEVDGKLIFNNNSLFILAEVALLHNIGKTCQNEAVRRKIGLTEYKESDIPVYGYKLLHGALMPNASVISVGVLFSKTYENKKNAPAEYAWALNKSDINHISKIINVANVYNNLIILGKENNMFIGPAEAMEMIRDLSGDVFDKNVVNAFVKNVAIYPIGSEVTLSNGEIGIVKSNNLGKEGFNYRPIVETSNGSTYNLLVNRDITIVPDNYVYDEYIRNSR